MRAGWLALAMAGTALLAGLLSGRWLATEARAERLRQAAPAGGGDLLAFTLGGTAEHSLLVVIDPLARVVASYEVQSADGAIALKSVRNIDCDLQMLEFNGQAPSPQDIRSLLDRGRTTLGGGAAASGLNPPARIPIP